MTKRKQLTLFILIFVICVVAIISILFLTGIIDRVEGTAHEIEAGTSFNDNPLKGFVPFSNSYADFPHSLEFFYIPMSSLYPDLSSTPDTKPDFTALEKELNVVAKRGNQAVFRIYIDYPTKDSDDKPLGIPAFLRKAPYNLDSHDYGDFENYISQIPDYSDTNLRKTIQNCITELGAKYDGDNRIGFITGGFLGFWGEWHCWPYNGVESYKNYEPTTEVFNEVIAAYEKAFKKTRVVLRYPAGNSPEKENFGFHDDSYCYETIPVAYGGDSWNFGEKLLNTKPSTADRWMTAPIGGELRPEVQAGIFQKKPWTGGEGKEHELWDENLKIIHPSWMINESIKAYKDDVKEAAIIAATQMGYDFRVKTAYYKDDLESNKNIKLALDIQNIGVAPFYYDNTSWPIKVGIKQNDKIVYEWTTDWDLSEIPANGKTVRLKSTSPIRNTLTAGYYNICIKVENPLPNGNKLGFANEGQYDDGWLDLGLFTVEQGGSMTEPAPAEKQVHKQKPIPKDDLPASDDPNNYEAEAEGNTITGTAKLDAGAKYSGGQKVGYIGSGPDSTLTINNIKAEKDGDYTITIYYTTAEPRSAEISVNDGEPINIDFPNAITWTKVITYDLPVKLKAGSNTLKFSNAAGWTPDIDRIVLK